MVPYINEVKERAKGIVEKFAGLGAQFGVKLNFMLVAYRDEGDAFKTNVFVPLTSDPEKIKNQLQDLTADGGGDIPEMVVEAIESALNNSGAGENGTQGQLNRIILIGDAPPHQTDQTMLLGVGAGARDKFTQIFALRCGDDKMADRAFRLITEKSGGIVRPISEASEMTQGIVETLNLALSESRIKTEVYGELAKGEDPGKTLNMQPKLLEAIRQRFAESGVTIPVVGGSDVNEGWVKVMPGSSRLKIHVMKDRFQLALAIQNQISLSKDITVGDAAKAPELGYDFLVNLGGRGAAAGLAKDGLTRDIKERAESLPKSSPALRVGVRGIPRNIVPLTKRVIEWRKYLRTKDADSDKGYVYIPADVAP
jgi:hypothetical protein